MQTGEDIKLLTQKIENASAFIVRLRNELSKVLVGQLHMADSLLTGLLCNGHILLEGVPGLAKTLAIKSMAQGVAAKFSRIQFTPDLLPADVIGTMIYNQARNEFVVRKGPIFANFILADEINRAPAKVQSALLEAMQEKQVTIGDTSYTLDEPFLVLATQNPLEQEGTYPLPEAQVDRFMLKIIVGYPDKKEEQLIIRSQVQQATQPTIQPVASVAEIMQARALVKEVYMDEKIEQYIVDIVFATRYPERYNLGKLKALISYGASPRGSINLAMAGKAHAFMQKRGFVIPDDIKAVCHDVLRHRIGITYEAEAENITTEKMIDDILKTVLVP
ncbi:MoxR family ATPase [soil metagenome]